jgi:lipopolysaccharide transport system ATP-binding protein
MSDIAIRVENLSKCYRIGQQQKYRTLRETLVDKFKSPIRKLCNPQHVNEANNIIWALKDISFDVKQGEVVGIIGRNGAGKSTLLKIISRITEPTEGNILMRGRVGSLLEVGTGFHQELTGRENIYLNGAILGMKRAEIARKFDEIVAFSEIEKFLDTPVKHYSSGMYVRLAFAVAAHLEPEILIVDEVLAVGDVEFQKKCLGKMNDVAHGGHTVLFVSHNMGAINTLCEKSIWLNKGRITGIGEVEDIVSSYLINGSESTGFIEWHNIVDAPGDDIVKLRRVALHNSHGFISHSFAIDDDIYVEIEYELLVKRRDVRLGFELTTSDGVIVFMTAFGDNDVEFIPSEIGQYKVCCKIPSNLLNSGHYIIEVAGYIPGIKFLIPRGVCLSCDVLQTKNIGGYGQRRGAIRPILHWTIER